MGVREHDGAALEVVVFNVAKYGVALRAGVDNGALERVLVGDYVAVGLQVSHRESFYKHVQFLRSHGPGGCRPGRG